MWRIIYCAVTVCLISSCGLPDESRIVQLNGTEKSLMPEAGAASSISVLTSDFNFDGTVDAADYTVWRDHLGATNASQAEGDATGDGIVDNADHAVWVSQFGLSSF